MKDIETSGVIVEKFLNVTEAEIVKGLLESNGIDAFIRNASFSNIFPGVPGVDSEIELYVRNEDAPLAMEILRSRK